MKFGSLFSGIGGLDLGLERAGMKCSWQVEIDDYATRVLAKHWPDVPRFRDVREVGKHNLESVDLICGGFPCQDISSAGKRAGIDGARSGLWAYFERIICQLRPRYVLVENSSALLIRGMDRVLADLSHRGYDAEWEVISACAFGAPHTRERVFIVAYPSRESRLYQPMHGRQIEQERFSVFDGIHLPAIQDSFGSELEAASRLCRTTDGIPSRVERSEKCGNAVVPQVAEFIGKQIINYLE